MADVSSDPNQTDEYLYAFLLEHTTALKQILRVYVLRMGLVGNENVNMVADEIFQDTMVEIITHRQRFLDAQQPRAWFLAVALHILQRRRVHLAKRNRFEVLFSDLFSSAEIPNEEELLERLVGPSATSPEHLLEARERVGEILALVSSEDAHVLNLTILHDLDSRTIAHHLGVSLEAARVRLHRALRRLRKAWHRHETHQQEERR